MTLTEQFEHFKLYGYVCDADDLPPRRWADGKMHVKKGGDWRVVPEGKEKSKRTEDPKVDDKGYPFEKTSDGDMNFGEVTQEMADAMGTGVAAPIRYSSGNYDYGKKHLEEDHLYDIEAYGFKTSNDFVEYVAQNFDEIYQGNQETDETGNVTRNTFVLTIHKSNMILYIELRKTNDEDYYSVGSGGIVNTKRYSKTKEKNKIWNRPTTDSQVADALAGVHACPLYIRNMASKAALPTNPTSNIAQDTAEVKSLYDISEMIKRDKYA